MPWLPPGRDLVSEIAEEIKKRCGRLAIGSPEYMGLRSFSNWISELTAVDPEAGA